MLSTDEIKMFIDEDAASMKKAFAKTGERYYDGDHDIRNYRLFYFNADGQLVEDKTRTNVKIPHPFFKELTDQGTQYALSGGDFIFSDIPELQTELDSRFNKNDDFIAELSELLTDCQTKGFAYMYAMKDSADRLKFTCANAIGVVEVESRFATDKQDHIIYWYVDRIDKEGHRIKKIMDWDSAQVNYYVQNENGAIEPDVNEPINPRPHILYKIENDEENTYYESLGFLPFFRIDNNRKQFSDLKAIKDLIDDYDIMASSLSNNLIDFDQPLYVVKGFEGDNLTELQTNLKTKKIIGVGDNGGVDVKTVEVPYQARAAKMELDEKNIYRFGMGLNLAGLKDTSATTNIAIKAAYSLLDLRCKKLEMNLRKFLRKIIKVCLDEINDAKGTGYTLDNVYFSFKHELISNEQENAQIALTQAQEKQTMINTVLSLTSVLGDETVIRQICETLELDYDEIKDLLPKDEEKDVDIAQGLLDEQGTEGSAAGTP